MDKGVAASRGLSRGAWSHAGGEPLRRVDCDVALVTAIDLDFLTDIMALTSNQFHCKSDEGTCQNRQDVRDRSFIQSLADGVPQVLEGGRLFWQDSWSVGLLRHGRFDTLGRTGEMPDKSQV